MEAPEAIDQRRAIKQFDLTHKLTDAEIETLMQAAIQSPTNCPGVGGDPSSVP